MWFLIEETRFQNVFENKLAKWPHCKIKTSKCTLTTNSYDFARRSGHERYVIKLSIE
jgi:hypothetical protein